ncbi:MAG TPA: G1 family glutamic endopeptidase [Pseudonocardiaceae bacterium]|nr:G1 family glutamic endopeptidase [Pseudonocardiaceae bacterium]
MRTTALAAALFAGAALVVGLVAPTATSASSAHSYAFDPMTHNGTAVAVSRVHGYNQNGYNWSGYVATGSGFSSVSTTWTEPSAKCSSTNDLYAPWVGIDGYGSNSVEQTGVQTDCSSGSPVDSAWYEVYPANPVYYSNAVGAGDVITATVTRSGTSYTMTLNDKTKNWTKTTTKSYNGANASAEVILESPTAAYPNFGTVSFTGSTVNGKSLSSYNPTAFDASNNSGQYEDHTGALSGGNFSVTYERQ